MVFSKSFDAVSVVLWSALILWNVQEVRSAPSINARAAEEVNLDAIARASNRDCQGQETFGGKGGDADAGPGGVGTGGRGGNAKAGSNCVGIGGKGGTGTGGRAAGSDAAGGKGQGGRGGDGYGGDYAVGIGGDGGDGIGQPAELGVGGDGGDGIGGKCAKGYGGKGGRGSGKRGKDGKSIDGDMTGCINAYIVGDKNRDAIGKTGESVDKTVEKMSENKFSGDSEPDARMTILQNTTPSSSTIQPARPSTTADVPSLGEERKTTERLSGRNVNKAIGAKKTKSAGVTLIEKDEDGDDEDGFLSAAKKDPTEEAAVPAMTQEGQRGTAVSLPVKVENGTSGISTTEIRAADGTSAIDTSTKDGKPVSMTISGNGVVNIVGQPLNEQSAGTVDSSTIIASTFIPSNKTV